MHAAGQARGAAAAPLLGEHVESLEKPVGDRVLQAMAQAYPDPVDLGLLSMVMGCEIQVLREAVASLVQRGLARTRLTSPHGDAAAIAASVITDTGMAIADGMAQDAGDAAELLARLEASALRQLLVSRVRASRLPVPQAEELARSLHAVADQPLIEAGSLLAHQTVSDWRGVMHAMAGAPHPVSHAASPGTP